MVVKRYTKPAGGGVVDLFGNPVHPRYISLLHATTRGSLKGFKIVPEKACCVPRKRQAILGALGPSRLSFLRVTSPEQSGRSV